MGANICSCLIDIHLIFFQTLKGAHFFMPHCQTFFIQVIKTIEFWYIKYEFMGGWCISFMCLRVDFFYMCMVRGGAYILFQSLNTGGRGWGQNKLGGSVDFFFDQEGWGALFSGIKGLFVMPHSYTFALFSDTKGE